MIEQPPSTDSRPANVGGAALAFIIPVRNDAAGLARCLRSIRATSSTAQIEVIVVDNGSVDGSPDVAKAAGCRVLAAPGHPVAALRNLAAASTAAPVLAFIDADHEIPPHWGGAALSILADPAVAAAGYPYSPPTPATWVQRAYDGFRQHPVAASEARWLASGNVAVRAEVFRAIGGFDASLEACEDVDFCARLRGNGYVLIADPRLSSVHHGDPVSLRALFRSELWRGRNNLLVSLRHRPSLQEIPGILFPVVQLAALVAMPIALTFRHAVSVAIAGAALLLPLLLRITILGRRAEARHPLDWLRVSLVAATYDTARALALVSKVSHRRARSRVSVGAAG